MKVLCLVLAWALPLQCLSQVEGKRPIDTSVYRSWPQVGQASICNNGNYISYVIQNIPENSRTMVVKSSVGSWEMRIAGVGNLSFTNNSRVAVCRTSNDSLYVIKLGHGVVAKFSDVSNVVIPQDDTQSYLLIYTNSNSRLLVYNYKKGTIRSFHSVSDYALCDKDRSLFIVRDSINSIRRIELLSLSGNNGRKDVSIWHGKGGVRLTIDGDGRQLAFLVADTVNGIIKKSCLYYKLGDKKSRLLFTDTSLNAGVVDINYLLGFNEDNTVIIFQVEKTMQNNKRDSSNITSLRIWSYLDKQLNSVKDSKMHNEHTFRYAYVVDSHSIYRLSDDGDILMNSKLRDKALFIHIDPLSDMTESPWNRSALPGSYLVSVKTGTRTFLERIGKYWGALSPDEKFVIYTDRKDYYVYDVALSEYRCISKGIHTDWSRVSTGDRDSLPRGVAGWSEKDNIVFVYDRYDIWMLDPKGKKEPVNLTNGYGRIHEIVFYLAFPEYKVNPIQLDKPLILNATSLLTKNNGFFKKDLRRNGDPELLTFQAKVFDLSRSVYASRSGFLPIKARDANKYIVSRMSAGESPNYFFTADFKKFIPLSSVYPEKLFNWYTTELKTWTTDQGVRLQGVLYKPENFDSTKKYPVIFNYYENKSFNLNVCLIPDYSTSDINIPTYVSNGYLVFTPDFEYRVGDPMQGAYNSVMSAVRYLSRNPYIDTSKMGIQGFSMGAIETYYLVANTNVFAAACAASGQTDFVSSYGSIAKSGYSLQGLYETGQNRMGASLWEAPDMYIKNSAIFKADKVTTPLLMMHTTNDEICPFSQAIEFFTALRRMGKKVWMLEYTDGAHSIWGRSGEDFSLRMSQFFDYYLKCNPKPKWMESDISTLSNWEDSKL